MLKNLTYYQAHRANAPMASEQEAAARTFTPCGPTQQKSIGLVPPDPLDERLVREIGGHLILKCMIETKSVPSAQINKRVDEMAAAIEQQTGRKPGKKQRKELKEEALMELLPAAFPKQSAILIWIDQKRGTLSLDTASVSKAEDIITLLVGAFDGLVVSYVQTEMSPQVSMSHWLGTGDAPYRFTVDRECELKSTDEMKSIVRYGRHPLDTDEVKQHIQSGKIPTKLALTWADRVSFVLTESGSLRKVAFLDVVTDEASKNKADNHFEANVALTTGDLSEMLDDLVEALGGKAKPQE